MPDDPQQFIASLTPIKSMRGQYEGYKEHVHNPSSTTETYFKVTARSNVPEWKNVKFILEAGKGFAKDAARVAVEVQQGSAIKEYGIQPDTSLVLGADGYDGYAELFRRMLAGDMSLFISIDEVRAAWKLIDAVRNDWLNNAVPLVTYPQGAYNQTL
jgi:glucose-6-phosphate 1-dehydrogenase